MPIMIQVSELSLADSDGKKIFKDLHFRLNRGEWACVAGPTGSGKTLLLRLLTGQCRPDQGQILVDERNILRINPDKLRQLRRRLGIVLADQTFAGKRTLRETIIFKLRALDAPISDALEKADSALELVGLQGKAAQPLDSLNEVERELFALGLALCHDPVLLLLDEPLQKIKQKKEKERYLEALERIHLRKRLTTLMTAVNEQFSEKFPILCYDVIDAKIKERQPQTAARDASDAT